LDITFLGGGCVKLSGKSITVVCDPYNSESGLAKLNVKADVVTLSGPEGFGELASGMTIDTPGEYEVRGATVIGVPARLHIDESGYRGTVFSVLIDGVNVVVTGNISGKLDEQQVENLGQVDVLVVPVGGKGLTLDAEDAAQVVTQLEPSYVIPVHYDDGTTTYPMPQDGVATFLQEMGSNPEAQSKLRINPKEAPAETQVVLLTRAGS
jgi:L-ascorbate metabolism protein UlaG (beta-lactamase superfamily)